MSSGDNALENYQKAFEWNKKTHNEYSLGKTYHQIGVLFHKQKRWTAAIENYNKALKWNKKTHNEHLIKMTYYQLGVFFEEQQNWGNSLENYFIALLMSHKFSVQGAEKGIIAAIKKNAKEVSEEMLYEVFQRVFKDCSESDRDQLWKSIFSVE
ncbi:MAG: tetratricopeptide repeat protein [Verrucomicrobiota bacterium]|nr:tetratricopeptide repeat protein [Verrucomicrobiota bacterium]